MLLRAKPIRVLLVDARPPVLRNLRDPLDPRSPRVELVAHARSYAVALAFAGELRPDVILFGLFADAQEALEVITALTVRCTAKILILKSLYESVSISKAMEAGAHGVVRRDIGPELIAAAVVDAHEGVAALRRSRGGGLSGYLAPAHMPWRGDPEHARQAQLTLREKEVICAIAADPSAKYISIADRLGISEHTVHNHLSRIYQKLELINRMDLLVYALRQGLMESEAPRYPGLAHARGPARPWSERSI